MNDDSEVSAAVEAILRNDPAQRARQNVALSMGVNADFEAELRRASAQTGVPLESVRAFPDEVQQRARFAAFDFDQMARQFPSTVDYLGKLDNAKIAHDDIENMTSFEGVLTRKLVALSKGLDRAGSFAGRNAQAGLYRAGAGFYGALAAPLESLQFALEQVFGPGKRQLASPLRGIADQQSRAADAFQAKAPRPDGTVEAGIASGIQSLTQNLMILPFGVAMGSAEASTGLLAALSGGQSYIKARDAGLDPGRSLSLAVPDAAAEYVTEIYGLRSLFDMPGVRSGVGRTLKGVLDFAGKEIVGEQVATIWQDFNDWMVLHPEKTAEDYAAERPDAAIQTLIATIVGAGGQIAVMSGINAISGRANDAQRAGPFAQVVTELGNLAEASKVKARDADTAAAFYQSMLDEGNDSVWVSPAALAQSGIGARLTQALPDVQAQLDAAVTSGSDIRVSIADLMARLPAADIEALAPHVAATPGGFTATTAQAYLQSDAAAELQQEVERILAVQTADAETKASVEAVRGGIKSQLDAAGRNTPEVNDLYATMVSNFYAVQAGKLGITPEEMFERYPLRITAAEMEGLAVDDEGNYTQYTQRSAARAKQRPQLDLFGEHKDSEARDVAPPPTASSLDALPGDYATRTKLVVDNTRELGAEVVNSPESAAQAMAYLGQNAVERFDALVTDAEGKPLAVVGTFKGGVSSTSVIPAKVAGEAFQVPGAAHIWFAHNHPSGDATLSDADIAMARHLRHIFEGSGIEPHGILAVGSTGSEGKRSWSHDDLGVVARGFAESDVPTKKRVGIAERVFSNTGKLSEPINNTDKAKKLAVALSAGRSGLLLLDTGVSPTAFVPLTAADVDVPLRGTGRSAALLRSVAFANPKYAIVVNQQKGPSGRHTELGDDPLRNVVSLLRAVDVPVLDVIDVTASAVSSRAQVSGALDALTTGGMFKQQEQRPDLIVQHSLSAENLLHAERMGGLAVPSLAITKADDALVNFGEITLLGGPDMADPQGYARTKVFGADIYSPRYPEIIYKLDAKAVKKLNEMLAPFRDNKTEREIYTGGVRKVDDLTGLDSVKAMADAQAGGTATWAELKQTAATLLRKSGAQEKLFEGFTDSGNRRYKDHTLENVVKKLKKDMRGGEGFNYGVGSLRAHYTPQFKTLKAIRSAKGRLTTPQEFETVKKEIDEELFALADALMPYHPASDRFGFMDTVTTTFGDMATMGARSALRANGFDEGIPHEVLADVLAFVDKLRNLPTTYFEAKITRAVSLSEFAGAVVPSNTPQEVVDTLRSAGIKDIRTYTPGDPEDRKAKVAEFSVLMFQRQESSAPRGAFDPESMTILLSKSANLSTFLHESGHFFLEVLADMAGRADAPTQVRKDFETVLRWFGLPDDLAWHSLDLEGKRPYHEQFARGFEAYLFEGKAPSIEMQTMFQRFRAWLTSVYQSIKALRVDLNDDVRGVMDRLLASDAQIALVEQGQSLMPLFASAEQAGMSPEEFAAYQSLGADATADASAALAARGLRDMKWMHNARSREIRRLQREVRELRAEVEIGVRQEVMSRPVYQAWAFLTRKIEAEDRLPRGKGTATGKAVDPTRDSLLVAIAKHGGLSREDAREHIGLHPDDFGHRLARFGAAFPFPQKGGLTVERMVERLLADDYLMTEGSDEAAGSRYDHIRQLEDMVQSELGGNPHYSLRADYDAIRRAEGRPGDQVRAPQNLQAGRLDLSALPSVGADTTSIELLKARRMTAANGLHPDIVAEMFGFTSGDELVQKLAAAHEPREEIAGLTDARMLEQHGDLATPEAIARAADAAVHNDLRAKVLAAEANALAKAVGQRKVLASAAQGFAAQTVARLKVRNVKPSQYARAEVKAAKAAEKAQAGSSLALAAAEKRNQLVAHYATRAAHDALAEVDAGLRMFKALDTEAARKRIDADYMDQIDQLLERFDLRKGQSLKAIDKRTALATWLASQREAGFDPEVPEALENEAMRRSYKDLTVEEFRGLVDTVRQIEHLGKLKRTLLTSRKTREYEAARDEIVASIEMHAGGRKADTRTPTTNVGRAVQGLRRFWASHVKAAAWARIMDGGRDGGPVWEYLIRGANERGDLETTMRAEATQKLSEILAPVMAQGRMGGAGVFFPTIGRSLNREARIAIALNTGNDGNMQRLLGGEGWTAAHIQPVLQSLTAAEWTAVQAVWDHFESYRPAIAEKERRVYGKEPVWVEPKPFTVATADGQQVNLRGGYYPIRFDPLASQKAEEHADAESATRQMRGAYTSATTRRSFTKTRVEEVNNRPLVYTIAGLYAGTNEVIHDLAWHEWLIDANRLLRSHSIDTAIRKHYGPEVKAQLKTWVRDIAEGERYGDHALDIALGRLRQGVTAAGLGFNAMSAMIQPLGITQSIVRVGPAWIGRSVMHYLAHPIDATRDANDRSEFMRNRTRTRFRELNELRNAVQDESAINELTGHYAYWMMLRMQQAVDVPTWHAAYAKALASGRDDADAVAQADQAVIDSQGSGMVKDLSAIERGGSAQRLFTVFYSFMNTAMNIGVTQAMTSAKTPAGQAKWAAEMLLLYTVPAVLGYALKQALQPGGDDDPEKLAKALAAEQLNYLMGLMVVVREIGELGKIAAGAEGTRDYQGPAGVRGLADILKFAQQVKQGEFDTAFRKSFINLMGDFFGVPAAQINRTISGAEALNEGKTENPAALAFGFDRS